MARKLSVQQDLFLRDVHKLLTYAWANGFSVTVGEAYRTLDQQGLHFANGRSKTMKSKHLKRLAIDLNFFKDDDLITSKAKLQQVGDHWEALNRRNRWGGNWGWVDAGHFEREQE